MHQLQKILISDLTVLQEFQVKSDYVCPWTKVLPPVTMHPFIPLSYLHRWGQTALIVNTDRLVTNLFQKATFPSPALRSWETRAASLTRSQAENCSRLAAIPVPTHASSAPVGASGIQMKQSHSDVTVLPLFQGEVKRKKKLQRRVAANGLRLCKAYLRSPDYTI